MPYSLSGSSMTQVQMDALAGLASGIPGAPFDFSGNNWRAELERLRTAARSAKYLNFGEGLETTVLPSEAVVSGPWPVIEEEISMVYGFNTFNGTASVIGVPLRRNNAFFVYGDLGTPARVITKVDFIGALAFGTVYEEGYNGSSDNTDKTRTYRARLETGGLTGRISGVAFSTLNGPGASSLSVECNLNHTITTLHEGFGGLGIRIDIDHPNFSGGEILIRVTNNSQYLWRGSRGNEGLSGIVFDGGSSGGRRLIWEHITDTPQPAIGLNRRAPVLKLVPPAASSLGIFHVEGNDVTKSYFENSVRFFGNQGHIYHKIEPRLLISDTAPDSYRGVWLMETLPVSNVGTNLTALCPAASQPTAAATSGAFGSVSTAVEFAIPRYHWRRNNNATQPAVPLSIRVPLGSCIHSIYVRRAPVESDGIWVANPSAAALNFRLGHYQNGFISHQSFTLEAGEVGKYLTLDQELWPILSHEYLLYDCAEQLDVQAVVCLPIVGNILSGNWENNPAVTFPIMPFHYEDTEALLNL